MAAQPVLVDCDTGIDDAIALLYLLSSEQADVRAITTVFGNISAATAATNCLRILELVGRPDIPVALGAEVPILGYTPKLAPYVHGDDGLGNTGLPQPKGSVVPESAAQTIVDAAHASPGELHIIATGPLTNLATALALDPGLVDLVAHVTIMGGAAEVPGNETAAGEANILHDPEGAQRVLDAGWSTTLVPLDVTMKELITEAHRTRLAAAGNPIADLVAAITDFYFDFFALDSFTERCSPVHDALAAAIALGDVVPLLAPVVPVVVDCSSGPSRGLTLCDTRGRYRGFPPVEGATCAVVLQTDGTFADALIDRFVQWPGAVGARAV